MRSLPGLRAEERSPTEMLDPHDEDRYLDLRRLSEYSSISVRTLRDYLGDEMDPLPSYRVKKKILVRKAEFDEWMMKHRTDPKKLSRMVDDLCRDLMTRP